MDANNPFRALGRYELRHLPAHLAEAGEDDVLDRLLRLEYRTETGTRNAWFDAKDSDGAADNPALYTLDVVTAWRAAERRSVREIDRGEPANLGTEFRYAAITGSTGSLAQRTSPVLRAALLQNGRWSTRRALDDAQRVADPERYIEALEALLPFLPDPDRLSALHDALTRAGDMEDASRRARALMHLVDLSPSDLRATALRKALDAVLHLDEGLRVGLLLQIVADLPSELSADALKVVETVENDGFVADVLARLASHLSVEQQPRALQVARALDNSYARARALAALSAALPAEPGFAVAAEALFVARGIAHRRGRAEAVIAIAPHIAGRLPDEVLDEVTAIVPFYRFRGLAVTIPCLAPGAARRGLMALASRGLAVTIPCLPPGAARRGLMALAAIKDEERRAAALEEIVPQLSPELLQDAVSLALDIAAVEPRATLLLALAERGATVLPEIRATISKISDPRILGGICATFGWADSVAEASLERALETALDPSREFDRIGAVRALAPALPARLLGRALSALGTIDSEYVRAEMLTALAAHIPDELLDAALEIAGAMASPNQRALSYRGLLPRLAGERLARAGREALRAVAETPIRRGRALVLDELVPLLPVDQLAEAAALGQTIGDEAAFVHAVLALAAELPPDARTSALREALSATRMIEGEGERVLTFCTLAARLPDELLPDALDIARGFRDDQVRSRALQSVAPFLDDGTRATLLEEARPDPKAIDDANARSWSLMSYASATVGDDRRDTLVDALAAAQAIWQEDERAMALAALVPDLPPEMLGDVFKAAMTLSFDEYDRAHVLKALAPRVSGDLAGQVLDAAQAIRRDQYRAMVLVRLIKRLPPDLRAVVRADAEAASDPDARTSLLEALSAELPADEATDVLETARIAAHDIQFLPSRAVALARLANGSLEQAREALNVTKEIEDERSRSTTLAEIAPLLPEELANDIATMARTFAGARERSGVLAAVAARVAGPTRTELAREAMAGVQESDWQLNEVTSKLEPSLGANTVDELVLELDRVSSDGLRARVATQLPARELHDAWEGSLSRLASQGREALFAHVEALVPQASALGGETVIVDIARCLTEVRRWWP